MKLARLKELRDKAIASNEDRFSVKGADNKDYVLLVSYAGYLIQWLEGERTKEIIFNNGQMQITKQA